jgi:integration host factor subunit alpha
MTLTKATVAETIQKRLHLSKTASVDVVESLLEIIKRTLENGEEVLISGFGKFDVKEKAERRGRNPQTGDDITLKPRRIVTFKCSGVLRDKINQNE